MRYLKGNAPLDVHPLLPDCREFFIFDSAGGIRPSDDPARTESARRAIQTLGLDIRKLEALRREAIAGVVDILQEDPSDEEIQQFIAVIDSRDADGQHTPFASAVVQVLRAYLPPATSV